MSDNLWTGGQPQTFDGGIRETWSCVGEHPCIATLNSFADDIRKINKQVADAIQYVADHNTRLAAENITLWRCRRPLEEVRLQYFVANWPT